MYFANEVNLEELNTVNEMVEAMRVAKVEKDYEVLEFMAAPDFKFTEVETITFCETSMILIKDIEVEVVSKSFYNKFSDGSSELMDSLTVPKLGAMIRRSNKRKGIEGIRLTMVDLRESEEFAQLKIDHKNRFLDSKRELIARNLLELRESGSIDLEKLEELRLEFSYEKAEDKKDFLIKNSFKGIDNLGVNDSSDDKYGHTSGSSTSINFKTKVICVSSWSSDD